MLEARNSRKSGTINLGAVGGGFACRASLLRVVESHLGRSRALKRRLGESASPEGLIASAGYAQGKLLQDG
jgi:hypothetical protein